MNKFNLHCARLLRIFAIMDNKGKIGSALVYGLTRPLAWLPLKSCRALGRAAGRFIGRTIGYRRDAVIANLARSFPEKKYHELTAICRRFYEHFGKVFMEAVWFGGCTDPQKLIRNGIVKMTNPEAVNSLYAKGKSVVVLTSHCGNWELYGGLVSYPYPSTLAYPENDICVVYRKQSSPTWDRFLGRNRIAPVVDKEHYDGRVESFSVMHYILRHRDRKQMYIFLNDQYPYTPKSCVNIRFMNQDTKAMDAAEHLARRLGLAVVYLSYREEQDGNYTMTFTPICEDATDSPKGEILHRYFELLEKDLREQPWNYLWTHQRWK